MKIKIKSCHFSWNWQAAVPSSSTWFGQFVRDKSRQHRRSLRVFFIYRGVWQPGIMMWWTIHANLLRETQNEKMFEKTTEWRMKKKLNTNHLWIWLFLLLISTHWLVASENSVDLMITNQNIYPLSCEPHFLFHCPPVAHSLAHRFLFIRTLWLFRRTFMATLLFRSS